MNSDAPGPRPRQVTIGGWAIAAASALLVVTVFDSMGNLHSVDTRDALTRTLTTGSLRDFGVSLADALAVLRWALLIAGTAAAVTGVLGIYVLQRHAAARIVLTVAAVPVVLTAPLVGGFLGLVIGGATALLWTRPARDWFAGRAATPPERPRPVAAPPPREPDRPVPQPTLPSSVAPPASSAVPPPMPGWGRAGAPTPPAAYGFPVGADPRAAQPYAVAPGRAPSVAVPSAVRGACILTWVFSGLTGAMYLLLMVALGVDRSGMLDVLRDNRSVRDTSLGDDQLVALLLAVSAVIVLWCAAAVVLAVLTWRRHRWAWILLQVSIGVAALVEILGFPYSIVHLAGCGIAFGLLRRAQTRAWFGAGPGSSPGGPPPGWVPPPGDQPPPQGRPPVW